MKRSAVMSLYEAMSDPQSVSKSMKSPRIFTLQSIEGAERGLRTRLLELGLVGGTRFEVERRGIHVTLKIRGDRLLLRRAEARVLKVVSDD